MRNHNSFHLIIIILACLLLNSCATTEVPSRWLKEAEEISYDSYGGWIDIYTHKIGIYGEPIPISGELIAIDKDTVYVADTILHSVALKNIESARLVVFQASGLEAFVITGTVSTISNGWYLVFTAPVWIFGGTAVIITRSYEPIIDYPTKTFEQFRPFARYPQGLPDGLDQSRIKMKSPRKR